MASLYTALGFLIAGFIALGIRATHAPYDYRQDLMSNPSDTSTLNYALDKAIQLDNK